MLRQDLTQALRGLRNNLLFATAAITMIGLGIGATTTIFSVVDHVLLRPLPYPDADRLVTIGKGGSGMSIPDFEDLRRHTSMFEAMGAQWDRDQDLTGNGNPERINVGQVTVGFLTTLGALPETGRLLVSGDFRPDVERTALLSDGFWKRRWGGDATIIGNTITLDGQPHRVVGVAVHDFVEPEALVRNPVDVWVPSDPPQPLLNARRASLLRVVAKLAADRNPTQARVELEALALTLAEQYPDGNRNPDGSPTEFLLRSLHAATVGDVTRALFLLMGAVSMMLLIACANVANLSLARGNDRSREMALRTALGASKGRLVRLLFTESVLLGVVGGAMGVSIAALGVKAFAVLSAGDLPRVASVTVDWRIVILALSLSILSSMLFGLLPAFRSARSDVSLALREGATSATGTRKRNRMRDALVIAEIALALMLLVGAGLLFNSFLHLRRVDPGFNTESMLTFGLRFGLPFGWSNNRYADPEAKGTLTAELLTAVRGTPGVVDAGGSLSLPFASNHFWGLDVVRTDRPADTVDTWIRPVTHGYMEALGIRLLAGRTFTASEELGRDIIPALVNSTLARRLWGDETPIGSELSGGNLRVRVVGVLEDLSHLSLDYPSERNLYVPFLRTGTGLDRLDLAVRYHGNPDNVARALRTAVWNIDPDLPVGAMLTMNDRMARSMTSQRFYAIVFVSFAGVALMLAASGIYASMMYVVCQRRRELGIRLAVGGTPGALSRLMVGRGALLTATGITIGLVGSLALSRLLDGLVFGITTTDRKTFVCVCLLLAGVGMVSCFLPARKAANADPMEVLRTE